MAKAVFSLSELLVLLDFADVPATSAPFPPMEEVAPLVELFGGYPTTAARLAAPGTVHVRSSEITLEITIEDLRSDEWHRLHGYLTSYLDDTLTKLAKSASVPGWRTYAGHGVLVLVTYSKPGSHGGYAEPRLDVKLLRDEHPLATFARLFGVSTADLAQPLDHRDARALRSTREMQVDVAVVGELLRLRSSAPTSRISAWSTAWLRCWGCGVDALAEVADRRLGEHEHAVRYAIGDDPIVTITGRTRHREHFEARVPRRWLTELAVSARTPGRATRSRS